MTGRFQMHSVPVRHRPHLLMSLRWGERECHFIDFRRFARIRCSREPLGPTLGGYGPKAGLQLPPAHGLRGSPIMRGATTTPRIAWLLRHGKQTGVGNYLANEALGRLKLGPFTPCRDEHEAMSLLEMCQRIAAESFRAGGTSFGSGYWRLDGTQGTYAAQLRFYLNPRIPRTVFRKRSVYTRYAGNLAVSRG